MLDIIFYVAGFIILSFGFVVFFGAPYVPTMRREVDDIIKLFPLGPGDLLVDVGSGDGVVLRAAARSGARAIGYELSPWLYVISKVLCRRSKNIKIIFANFWLANLPKDTTVVYVFLNGRYMQKLARKLEKHAASTGRPLHVISYGFVLPGYKPAKNRGPLCLYKITPLQT